MENEQKQTRITLKAVKYSASLSQETAAFTADVLFDGKRIAHARNEGCGGSTSVDPYDGTAAAVAEAEKYAGQFRNTFGDHDLGMHTLDSLVDDLLDDYLTERDLKKLLKSTAGVIGLEIKVIRGPYSPAAVAAFRRQHPDVLILNAIPYEDALKIYRSRGEAMLAAVEQARAKAQEQGGGA